MKWNLKCQGILLSISTDFLRFSLHVESSAHVESYFFNYIPTNSLFFLYFYSFILTFFLSPHFPFFLRFSPLMTHRPHHASLLNPPDSLIQNQQKSPPIYHSSSKINSKSNNSKNPSTHSNLPIKPTKNYPKSNQITKPRSSSTPGWDRRSTQAEISTPHQAKIDTPPRLRSSSTLGWDQHSTLVWDRSFNRGERAGEKGRKEKEKREEREPIVEMREGKKKKKRIKNGTGPDTIFLFSEEL